MIAIMIFLVIALVFYCLVVEPKEEDKGGCCLHGSDKECGKFRKILPRPRKSFKDRLRIKVREDE